MIFRSCPFSEDWKLFDKSTDPADEFTPFDIIIDFEERKATLSVATISEYVAASKIPLSFLQLPMKIPKITTREIPPIINADFNFSFIIFPYKKFTLCKKNSL